MADYYPLIARAIAGLDPNAPGESRRALYERARTALIAQLRSVQPPLSESEITRERLSLEEAVRKVESEAAQRAREASRPGGGAAESVAAARGTAAAAAAGPACLAGALSGFRFDLAHGFFQRQPLAGDFGFGKRRLNAAQLCDQRGARPLIERTAALAWSIGVQACDGARDQRVIISHFSSILQIYF